MVIKKEFWNAIASSWISVEKEEDKKATSFFASLLGGKVGTSEEKVKSLAEELFGEVNDQ